MTKSFSDEGIRRMTAITGLPVPASFVETFPLDDGYSSVHLCLEGMVKIDGVRLLPGIDPFVVEVFARSRRITIHAALIRAGMGDAAALDTVRAILAGNTEALARCIEGCMDCPECIRTITPMLQELVNVAPDPQSQPSMEDRLKLKIRTAVYQPIERGQPLGGPPLGYDKARIGLLPIMAHNGDGYCWLRTKDEEAPLAPR